MYQSFGLSAKTHTRTTLNVDYMSDAKERIKIGQVLRRDPESYSAKTRAARDVMSDYRQARNGQITGRIGVPNTNSEPPPKMPSNAQLDKARDVLKNVDERTGTEGIVKIPKSFIAQDDRIGAAAKYAVADFTSEVVRQRLTRAAAPMRDYERSSEQKLRSFDRGR